MLHQHLHLAGATPAGLTSLALPAEIRAAIKAGAWIVFNVSGGKDSSAAMFAVSIVLDGLGHPRNRRLVIHADLGRAEWESTPAMVERLAALADLPLSVVRRGAGDLFDRWAQRFENGKRRYEALETYNLIGPWSSASLRFCTSEAKAHVIGPHLARIAAMRRTSLRPSTPARITPRPWNMPTARPLPAPSPRRSPRK